MQFDLLQNDLFTDEPQASPLKKTKAARKAAVKPKEAPSPEVQEIVDAAELPPLPDSLLSVLSQPPEAEFHDEHDTAQDATEEELSAQAKSPEAFKTISEAAQILELPQHVLRFWESRFSQIRPIKSRGGRRYYRPEDMKILSTIKHLLYKQGYTIKGAKKAFSQLKKADLMAAATPEQATEALSIERAFAQIPPKSALSEGQVLQLAALRNELLALRDTLKLHM